MQRNDIEEILAAAGTRPIHRLGQHFMLDQRVLDRIINAAELAPRDLILEVGPGPGNLTAQLSPLVRTVLAVDVDKPLLAAAARYWDKLNNVQWMNADVLAGKHRLNPEVISALRSLRQDGGCESMKLVSNLPYNAASPLIMNILAAQCAGYQSSAEAAPIFECLVFTVQWEVGQRMRAATASAYYGSLSVLIALLAQVEVLASIPPGAFWPPPKVKSALVRIRPSTEKMRTIGNVVRLQRTVSNLFSHRRQNIRNAIYHSLAAPMAAEVVEKTRAAGIDPARRSESLAPVEFLRMSECWPE
ncbi:MAG: 16S rRNA (adenine(1518)-N(6)/adenine(1519)-N(6))-dimethyltransferase RsmA [Phycisphaerae bacterium]